MKTTLVYVVTTCVFLACLATGFLVGWFLSKATDRSCQNDTNRSTSRDGYRMVESASIPDWARDLDPEITKRLMDGISARKIEDNLRWLSAIPRVAGTEADLLQARAMEQIWKDQGMDNAGIETYDVLLSYPGNESMPNKVVLKDKDGKVIHDSTEQEEKPPSTFHHQFGQNIPPFTAYSSSGVVEGEVVYVDFGQAMDFIMLANRYNISFDGKIVLTRLGECSVRDKVTNAARFGAAAVLTFSNPMDDAPEGFSKVYPETWWMPPDAVRRGSILNRMGDPLTPGYPAKEGTFRRTMEEVAEDFLSEIPVQPVSAKVAGLILSHFAEDTPLVTSVWPRTDLPIWNIETLKKTENNLTEDIPEVARKLLNESMLYLLTQYYDGEYQMKNVNYSQESVLRVGGRMRDGAKVRVEIHTHFERRPTYDAFAIVRGAVEQDRVVVVGSHRDAWGHGAVDPGGGTATMMEISRVVGNLMREGWRPRRTLIFGSWGAEEFGLIGSTEWVEEKMQLLRHKAVAYLNLDIVVTGGNVLQVSASPLLHDLLYESAKEISHPKFPSLYHAWRNYTIKKFKSLPKIRNLVPDSDFASFYFSAGVPAMSVYYAEIEYFFYPTYHTNYDTFEYVKKFTDPTFEYHRLMGQYFVNMLHKLLDKTVLPLTTRHFSSVLDPVFESSRTVMGIFFSDNLNSDNDLLEQAEYCIRNFTYAADDFHNQRLNFNSSNPYAVRRLNDQLMLLERAFINDQWQEKNQMSFPHTLFGPSNPSCFMMFACCPGLNRAFCDKVTNATYSDHRRILHEEITVLCHAVDSAIDILIV